MVTQGELDRFIVRPLGIFFQFCFDKFNFIGFTDLIPGLCIFIWLLCIRFSSYGFERH
jgi:ABC-2 type transport system permease protein